MRKLQMIAAMAILNASAFGARTYVLRDELANPMEGFEIGPRRNRSKSIRRGKKAPRRHGAKLKPNRLTISKRVRRKHRRSV